MDKNGAAENDPFLQIAHQRNFCALRCCRLDTGGGEKKAGDVCGLCPDWPRRRETAVGERGGGEAEFSRRRRQAATAAGPAADLRIFSGSA